MKSELLISKMRSYSRSAGESSSVVSITVTYNPTVDGLERQLHALSMVSLKVVVDNASNSYVLSKIERLLESIPQSKLVSLDSNVGLAAAINRGAMQAFDTFDDNCFLLLMDQDSEPEPRSIYQMVEVFHQLRASGEKAGCVGPNLIDRQTGLSHGFHQARGWRWRRHYATLRQTEPVPCSTLNGGGTLVPMCLFRELKGLDEDLFIDHVDSDWSFRVIDAGYSLWGIPSAVFMHRMGVESRKVWLFGWHVWPVRTSLRHYYLFRNAVLLMNRRYVPRVWKVWAIAKLFITLIVVLIVGPERLSQIRSMRNGVRDGLAGCKAIG